MRRARLRVRWTYWCGRFYLSVAPDGCAPAFAGVPQSGSHSHVSASPPFHPGRSDFPSPVGGPGFPPAGLPACAGAQEPSHIHPLRARFTHRLGAAPRVTVRHCVRTGLSPRDACQSREPLCLLEALPLVARRQAPRRRALPLLHRSYGLMGQTQSLPASSDFPRRRVFAGCSRPLLGEGPSRRYLRSPCRGAWTHTPRRSSGALARFFPVDVGLTFGGRGSARRSIAAMQLLRRRVFEAAVIPLCSGSPTR